MIIPDYNITTPDINPVLNIKDISKIFKKHYGLSHKETVSLLENCDGYSKRTNKVISKRKFRQSLRDKEFSWEHIMYICPFYEKEREFPIEDNEKKAYGCWYNREIQSGSMLRINIVPEICLVELKMAKLRPKKFVTLYDEDDLFTYKKYLILVSGFNTDQSGIDIWYRMIYDMSKNEILFVYLGDNNAWYPIDLKVDKDPWSLLENMYRVWTGTPALGIEYANLDYPQFHDVKDIYKL